MERFVYFFYLSIYLMVSTAESDVKCQPTEVLVKERVGYEKWQYECKRVCPSHQYVYRKKCYDNCPTYTSAKENGFIKYCVSDLENFNCPKSICQKEYPFCFDGNCIDTCPEYTIGYNNSCVLKCPLEARYMTAHSCEGICYTGRKTCFQRCPSSHPQVFRSPFLYHCLKECPYFTVTNGSRCEFSCPSDSPFLFNNTCHPTCPSSVPFTSLNMSAFNKIFVCSERCDAMMGSYKNVCVSICPSRSPFEYQRKCVKKCGRDSPYVNTSPSKKSTIYYQQCVAECPRDKFLWMKTRRCVTNCPRNTLFFKKTCVSACPRHFPLNYTKENQGRIEHECVRRCPGDAYHFKDHCFDQCPTYLKHYLSNCTTECPTTYPYIISDNNTCALSCPKKYVYNGNICDKKCPKDKFYIENKICEKTCSNISAFQKKTKQGIICLNSTSCPNDTVIIEGTNRCIEKCPKTMLIINNICRYVTSCPSPFYTENSTRGKICTKKCSKTLYVDGHFCVELCPKTKVLVGQNCSKDCPNSKPCKHLNNTDYKNPMNVCVQHCPNNYDSYIYPKTCECDNKVHGVINRSSPPLYTGLAWTFFSLSFILWLLFGCMCCYRGVKCPRKSSQRDSEYSCNLIEEELHTG
ncbi:proprotein convertase subtilisin/kexin type 5-like [Ostrea edulis]|uniref:proprotein convertase subtilisin/kexin type 5-like n=1 Tax=Ostrea edulis TaxID=37623 RepID=UPI0024AF04FA|nr:proprotein convertase subtilisin/kexin type 5-like [Ostrea edulis]